MAKSQHPWHPLLDPDSDPLAAVALHTLVHDGRDGMSANAVALACERDPEDSHQLGEVQRALELLLADGLAHRVGSVYRPTHAAIRAEELRF